MFEMGLVVGLGLLFSMAKMSWQWKLKVLSSPLVMDALIFIGLLILHWGTFSGVMVATIGALACSVVLSMGRILFGFYSKGETINNVFVPKGKYVPGKFNIEHKLKK